MNKVTPKNVRFIKLGQGGEWEATCIQEGMIRLGYESPYHQESMERKWDVVKAYWLDARQGNQGAATRDVNQIRDFYELSEADVWITFFRRKLYWCQVSPEVLLLGDGSRIRKTINGWHSTDVNGTPLSIENLDGRLTKVQGYRGTICTVDMQDYLVRKINGEVIEEVKRAKLSLDNLRIDIEDLIKGLWWHDFELLVDLIFSKGGWQRFSVVGKTEKDLDLDLYSTTTKKRAFVQIKSTTNKSEIEKYISSFNEYEKYDEMYFVYHTGDMDRTILDNAYPNIHVWNVKRIAELVVSSGLVEWLLSKRS